MTMRVRHRSARSNKCPGATATPAISKCEPAGVCCHELATMIHTALKCAPSATMQVAKKCSFGPTRSQPNSRIARNPDSRKNAKIPSAASALPKISPTKREYVAQLVPNSNSSTMPVATPRPKIRPNILVQKRAML